MSADPNEHRHSVLHTHHYFDRSIQRDKPCTNPECDGVLRVTMFYAPDRGRNWMRCCCCGKEEV